MEQSLKCLSLMKQLEPEEFTEFIGALISINNEYQQLIINAISDRLNEEYQSNKQHHDDIYTLNDKLASILSTKDKKEDDCPSNIFDKISDESIMKCIDYLSPIDYATFASVSQRMHTFCVVYKQFKSTKINDRIPVRTKGNMKTFIKHVKETRKIKKKGVSKSLNWVIRDNYTYESIPNPHIHIHATRKIDIRRVSQLIDSQCHISLNKDTANNVQNYLVKYLNGDTYPPIFIPTIAQRINDIDLREHYNSAKCWVFLVVHSEDYKLFYEKYYDQYNFFFITHEEESIILIRQCIKFFVTCDLLPKWKDMGFYYECDDDIKKIQYYKKGEIKFDECLELLYTYIKLLGDRAIILSISPSRRFWRKNTKKNMFAATTKCEKFKIIRICQEFKDVNYASQDMLLITSKGWKKMKNLLNNKNLGKNIKKNIQKNLRQGEDFGLCEQLAVATKKLEYSGKQYEASFKTRCFIFEHIGIVEEYQVKSVCETLK
eukprot:218339_1